jgi:hypothetical protein
MAYDEAHRQVVLFGGGGRGEVPTLQDAKRLWWHLQQRGWMAHELLAVA